MAVSMYELKLGSEKLEALKLLLSELDETIRVFESIDLDELKQLDLNININKNEIESLKADFDNKIGLFNSDNSNFKAKYNELIPKFNEFVGKYEAFLAEFEIVSEKHSQAINAAQDVNNIKEALQKLSLQTNEKSEIAINLLTTANEKIADFNPKYDSFTTTLTQLRDNLNTANEKIADFERIKTEIQEFGVLRGEKGEKGDKGDPATNLVQSVAGKQGVVTLNKTDVGLNNVDNTADLAKPISTATQQALDSKLNLNQKGIANGVATLDTDAKIPIEQIPTLDKSYIGLDNVDNTTDLAKPISTATQQALDSKLSITDTATDSDKLNGLSGSEYALKTELNTKLDISTFNSGIALLNTATHANTPNTIVKRNADGDFNAGNVTAVNFRATTPTTDNMAIDASTILFKNPSDNWVRVMTLYKLKSLLNLQGVTELSIRTGTCKQDNSRVNFSTAFTTRVIYVFVYGSDLTTTDISALKISVVGGDKAGFSSPLNSYQSGGNRITTGYRTGNYLALGY